MLICQLFLPVDINGQAVNTVLLDRNGTLLNLAFDNFFWQKRVSETFAAARSINLRAAQKYIARQYHPALNDYRTYSTSVVKERS